MVGRTELEDLSAVAAEAAERGGRIVAAAASRPPDAIEKARGDYVTETDRQSEIEIAAFLSEETPGVAVAGEEFAPDARSDRYWLVDPLDGTTNFLHGFVAVGVSVAFVQEGRPVAGAVHAPLLGATWTAARGYGAWCGGRRLAVSERPPSRAVVGTGFPFRRKDLLPRYLAAFDAALATFEDLRRPGAAALDLAWVAEGVFDGFFELALGPWDVAAGSLLIEEAGGVVTDWDGHANGLSGDVLAGAPAVHARLLGIATHDSGAQLSSVGRADALEAALAQLLEATDGVHHLEGTPRAIADLSAARIFAREALDR